MRWPHPSSPPHIREGPTPGDRLWNCGFPADAKATYVRVPLSTHGHGWVAGHSVLRAGVPNPEKKQKRKTGHSYGATGSQQQQHPCIGRACVLPSVNIPCACVRACVHVCAEKVHGLQRDSIDLFASVDSAWTEPSINHLQPFSAPNPQNHPQIVTASPKTTHTHTHRCELLESRSFASCQTPQTSRRFVIQIGIRAAFACMRASVC